MTTNSAPSDLGAPYNYYVGCKYERSLNVADIAKRIRKDIAAELKAGTLPAGLKTSVRISRYSMGQSIRISINAVPFLILNPAWVRAEDSNRVAGSIDMLTPTAKAVRDMLMSIGDAYNYDRSDTMTDYFDNNFCLFVEFDWRMRDREADAIRAVPENIAIKPKEIA